MLLKAGSTTFSVDVGRAASGIEVFALADMDMGMSITNNAASVIQTIVNEIGNIPDTAVVVYKDTQGIWDGLTVQNNHFGDFYSLGTTFKDEAISMAVAKKR